MHINDSTFTRILENTQDALLNLKRLNTESSIDEDPAKWYNAGYNEGRAQGKIDMLEFLLEEFREP
jgi:hypothetical protein